MVDSAQKTSEAAVPRTEISMVFDAALDDPIAPQGASVEPNGMFVDSLGVGDDFWESVRPVSPAMIPAYALNLCYGQMLVLYDIL